MQGDGGQPGPPMRVLLMNISFSQFVPGLTGPDPSFLCLLFALMQKVTKRSRLQKNGGRPGPPVRVFFYENFVLFSVQETCSRTLPGPDLSGLCLLFALMQKVTKKSRLQKNG